MDERAIYESQLHLASDDMWSISIYGHLLDKKGAAGQTDHGRILVSKYLPGRTASRGNEDEDDLVVLEVKVCSGNFVRKKSLYNGPLKLNNKKATHEPQQIAISYPRASRAQLWKGCLTCLN